MKFIFVFCGQLTMPWVDTIPGPPHIMPGTTTGANTVMPGPFSCSRHRAWSHRYAWTCNRVWIDHCVWIVPCTRSHCCAGTCCSAWICHCAGITAVPRASKSEFVQIQEYEKLNTHQQQNRQTFFWIFSSSFRPFCPLPPQVGWLNYSPHIPAS